jgi:hypothetical protein
MEVLWLIVSIITFIFIITATLIVASFLVKS